jgi:hypothetical protein
MPDESAAHARDRADLDAFLAHLHTRRDLVDFPPDYGELVTQMHSEQRQAPDAPMSLPAWAVYRSDGNDNGSTSKAGGATAGGEADEDDSDVSSLHDDELERLQREEDNHGDGNSAPALQSHGPNSGDDESTAAAVASIADRQRAWEQSIAQREISAAARVERRKNLAAERARLAAESEKIRQLDARLVELCSASNLSSSSDSAAAFPSSSADATAARLLGAAAAPPPFFVKSRRRAAVARAVAAGGGGEEKEGAAKKSGKKKSGGGGSAAASGTLPIVAVRPKGLLPEEEAYVSFISFLQNILRIMNKC